MTDDEIEPIETGHAEKSPWRYYLRKAIVPLSCIAMFVIGYSSGKLHTDESASFRRVVSQLETAIQEKDTLTAEKEALEKTNQSLTLKIKDVYSENKREEEKNKEEKRTLRIQERMCQSRIEFYSEEYKGGKEQLEKLRNKFSNKCLGGRNPYDFEALERRLEKMRGIIDAKICPTDYCLIKNNF